MWSRAQETCSCHFPSASVPPTISLGGLKARERKNRFQSDRYHATVDFGYSLTSREPKTETIPPEILLGGQRQEGNGRSPSPEVLSDQRPLCPYPVRSRLFLPNIPISEPSPNFLQHPHVGFGKWGGERKGERVPKSQQQKQNKTTTTTTKNQS